MNFFHYEIIFMFQLFSQGTPRNIYRHVILSDIKDATTSLPRVRTIEISFIFDMFFHGYPKNWCLAEELKIWAFSFKCRVRVEVDLNYGMYFVTKIVLIYCEKTFWKFSAFTLEFQKFFSITRTIYSNSERVTACFFNLFLEIYQI